MPGQAVWYEERDRGYLWRAADLGSGNVSGLRADSRDAEDKNGKRSVLLFCKA